MINWGLSKLFNFKSSKTSNENLNTSKIIFDIDLILYMDYRSDIEFKSKNNSTLKKAEFITS